MGENAELIVKLYQWESETFADYGKAPGPIDGGSVNNIDQEEMRYGQDIKYLYKSDDQNFKFVVRRHLSSIGKARPLPCKCIVNHRCRSLPDLWSDCCDCCRNCSSKFGSESLPTRPE